MVDVNYQFYAIQRLVFENNKYDFVSRLVLSQSPNKIIQRVLGYIYTHKIVVGIQTVESVIMCAQELDLKDLIKICEKCLIELGEKHSLLVLQIARKCQMRAAYYQIFWYVCNHFDECIRSSHFVEVTPSLMFELLSNKSKRRNETFLFERLLAWIASNKHLYEEKKMVNLLMRVDFGEIRLCDFERALLQNNFILKIPECVAFFQEKIK